MIYLSLEEALYKDYKMPQQKRLTAFKIRIKDLLNGQYIKEEGWLPNYVILNEKKVSRVNIIGAIVSVDEGPNYKNFTLDDGSGKISVREFEGNLINNFNVGNTVLLIGRPREFGSERYIIPEIIKNIDDKKWIEVRKQELGISEPTKQESVVETKEKQDIKPEPIKEEAEKPKEEIVKEEKEPEKAVEEKKTQKPQNKYEQVYNTIKDLDKGQGIGLEDIKVENAEEIIKNLLTQGEIFEIKPGRYKVLE